MCHCFGRWICLCSGTWLMIVSSFELPCTARSCLQTYSLGLCLILDLVRCAPLFVILTCVFVCFSFHENRYADWFMRHSLAKNCVHWTRPWATERSDPAILCTMLAREHTVRVATRGQQVFPRCISNGPIRAAATEFGHASAAVTANGQGAVDLLVWRSARLERAASTWTLACIRWVFALFSFRFGRLLFVDSGDIRVQLLQR